jgi:hypothetical protein
MIDTETIACPACKVEQETYISMRMGLEQKLDRRPYASLPRLGCVIHGLIVQRMARYLILYPAMVENEYLVNDYLEMVKQMEKFRQKFGLFMPDSNKLGNLLVVFSMDEMINQIKFRNQLFEMENSVKVA